MKLREAIKTIVREVVGDDLRQLVREVLMEELLEAGSSPEPAPRPPPQARPPAAGARSEAAKKAARTRAANKLPQIVRDMGLAAGQSWRGKQYIGKIKDRVIMIESLDQEGVLPRIVSAKTERTAAKRITYEHLRKSYERLPQSPP